MGWRAVKCCLLDRSVVLLNSQQLWLSSQGTLQHVRERVLGGFTSSWGAIDSGWLLGKGASLFSRVVAAGRLSLLWWRAPNPYACRKRWLNPGGRGAQGAAGGGRSWLPWWPQTKVGGKQCVRRSRIREKWEGRVGSNTIEVYCIYVLNC